MNHVIDCDIISVDEYYKLKFNISPMHTAWALKDEADHISWHPSYYVNNGAIRPCLRMDECDVPIGTQVTWYGVTWKNIGDKIFLCDFVIDFVDENISYNELHELLLKWWKAPKLGNGLLY